MSNIVLIISKFDQKLIGPAVAMKGMRELLSLSLRAPEVQRLAAEKKLQQLQKEPLTASFLAALLEMCLVLPNADGMPRNLDQIASEDLDVRLLAVLWLKQYLKSQWRTCKTTHLLPDEERAHLRGVLLFAALHEPQQTVALHLSLIVAAIARADFPTQWSFQTLFPVIIVPLNRQDGAINVVRERRGVDVCYRVVKELATRRLMQHRKQFAMLSVELLPLLLQYWSATATQLNGYLQTQQQAVGPTTEERMTTLLTTADMQQLHVLVTTTKVISIMLLQAFRDLSTLQNGEFMRSALIEFYNQLEKLVEFRHAFKVFYEKTGAVEFPTNVKEAIATLDKCMHHIAAIVVGVQHAYPIEFREYLPPYLTLFWSVLNLLSSSTFTNLASPQRLQIDALQFFVNVLGCRLYKNESLSCLDGTTKLISKVITATGVVALTDTMVLDAQAAIQKFFTTTENQFASMLNLLLMHYMKLTPEDLDEWKNDPEAYYALTESLTAKESARACAENLFLTLVQNFPDQTIPALTFIVSSTEAYLVELGRGLIPNAIDDVRVLEVDAILVAIGLGSYDLHDCFDFEPWFLTNLVPILVNQDAAVGSYRGLPVLRFRIVWLVSCWLAQHSASVRPQLYDALLNPKASFYQAGADVALKLRIIQTLESMMYDWGFEYDAFEPFLMRSLACLFAFFPQAVESESKLKVLGCLEAIVQACGTHMVEYSHQITVSLPAIWSSERNASNLVRGKILQLMTKLLSCVKDKPSKVPVAAGNVEALLAMSVQLIRCATDVSNIDHVFLMENGLELWIKTLDVSTVYTEELHVLFGNVLRLMERDYEHVLLVAKLMKHYLQLGKIQFWQLHHTDISRLLHCVFGNVKAEASLQIAQVAENVVATVPVDQMAQFLVVVKAMVDSCITFQQGKANHEPDSVVAAYLSVIARLMVVSLDFTLKNLLMNDSAVLMVLVDVMLRLFNTIGSSQLTLFRRKVWAMALCSTLILTEQSVLKRIDQILEVCAEFIDNEEEERTHKQLNSVNNKDSDKLGALGAFQAHYTDQQQNLSEQDAHILAFDLKSFVCERLNVIASKLGNAAFDQILQTVDTSVLRKF